MSTEVRTLCAEGDQDYAVLVDNLHVVDIGPVHLMTTDLLTRDGQPMEVRWSPDRGFLVAVQSS